MGRKGLLALSLACVLLLWQVLDAAGGSARARRPSRPLGTEALRAAAQAIDGAAIVRATREQLLYERQPGSPGSARARAFIESKLRAAGFTVELDQFTAETPRGTREFVNIVGTLDPGTGGDALVLGAHYDTKTLDGVKFVGATDSAVPVMMLLEFARIVAAAQVAMADGGAGALRGSLTRPLQLVFFDGEEAYGEWSATDSLYGSRHLAAQWEASGRLRSMGLLMVLDLIGAARPTFHDMFDDTGDLYAQLQRIESKLNDLGLIEDKAHRYFLGSKAARGVQDDHLPFVERGVRALHLIAVPFPSVWHTARDDATALSAAAVSDVARIVFSFVSEFAS